MIIPYNKNLIEPHQLVDCESPNCMFKRTCANHTSAGEFRNDGGFSPKLVFENNNLHCNTADLMLSSIIRWDPFNCPYDHNDYGAVLWKDLLEVEEFSDYQI